MPFGNIAVAYLPIAGSAGASIRGTDVRKLLSAADGTADTTSTTSHGTGGATTRTVDPYTASSADSDQSLFGWMIDPADMNSVTGARRFMGAGDHVLTARLSTNNVLGSANTQLVFAAYRIGPSPTRTATLLGTVTTATFTIPAAGGVGTFTATLALGGLLFANDETIQYSVEIIAPGTAITGKINTFRTGTDGGVAVSVAFPTLGTQYDLAEAATAAGIAAAQRYTRLAGEGAGQILTADESSFEVSSASWTAGASSVARSTALAYVGAASLAVTKTPAGTGTYGAVSPKKTGVVVGRTYKGSGFVRASTLARSGFPVIDWYTAADAAISQATGAVVTEVSGGWIAFNITAVAPATAAKLDVGFLWTSVPQNEVHHIDNVLLSDASVSRAAVMIGVATLRRGILLASKKATMLGVANVIKYARYGAKTAQLIGLAAVQNYVRLSSRSAAMIGSASTQHYVRLAAKTAQAVGAAFALRWTRLSGKTATMIGAAAVLRYARLSSKTAQMVGLASALKYVRLGAFVAVMVGLAAVMKYLRKVPNSAVAIGVPSAAREVTAHRQATATMTGAPHFARSIIAVRQFSALAVGAARMFAKVSQEILNRLEGGGVIIVRKVKVFLFGE